MNGKPAHRRPAAGLPGGGPTKVPGTGARPVPANACVFCDGEDAEYDPEAGCYLHADCLERYTR